MHPNIAEAIFIYIAGMETILVLGIIYKIVKLIIWGNPQ